MNKEAILPMSILLGLLLGLALIIVIPSTMTYSMANTGPEGFSRIHELLNGVPVDVREQLDEIDPESTAIIISRMHPLDEDTVNELSSYVSAGGVVLLAGSPAFINNFTHILGLDLEVWDALIYDMVHNGGSRAEPSAHGICNTTLVARGFHPLNTSLEVIAWTSEYAYLDINNNTYLDLTEKMGTYPVAARVSLGRGWLIVVSSEYVFTNEYLEENIDFIKCIIGNRTLLVDQSEIYNNILEYFKLKMRYQPPERALVYVSLITALVGAITYEVAKRV